MMLTKVVTAPAELPVTLAWAKAHLKSTITAEDALILQWIHAATEHAEDFTNRRLITQTLDGYLDEFPEWGIELPKPPVQSVTSVKYLDEAGVEQTLATSDYVVDATNPRVPARITPAYGLTWPTTRCQVNAVTVRFVCGYGLAGAVPFSIKAAIQLLVQWHEGRQAEAELVEAAERLLQRYRIERL